MRKERDLFKFNLEKATELLNQNQIQIEIEEANSENQEPGEGMKLIDEYTNKIESQKTKLEDKKQIID